MFGLKETAIDADAIRRKAEYDAVEPDDLFDSQSWELVDAGHSDTSLGCIRYTLCKGARAQ